MTGPKRTALGEGWFVTTKNTWYAGEEPVAEMVFRVLKYRPALRRAAAPRPRPAAAAAPAGPVMRPPVSPDTAFFWAGTAAGELRIQRCGGCGALRHPPGPRCLGCGAATPGYVVAAGHRHGLQLRGAPPSAGAGQAAADRDRAGRAD